MTFERALREALAAALNAEVGTLQPVSGGDINLCFAASLTDGRELFIKTHAQPPAGMYRAEARGLRLLTVPGGPRVPEVVAATEQLLVLERLHSRAPAADHDARFGHTLATLHRATLPSFGLDDDNFIGTLPQPNAATETWAGFYAQRRLAPMLRQAVREGRATAGLQRAVEQVIDRITELVGPPEPPARVHGDLWSGNAITDGHGWPVLIDPAAYGGHREVDLAMMRLFGGFSPRVFEAYAESYPLAAGHASRIALYQLYPLLVHLNLFGGHYVRSAQSAAEDALRSG